MIRAKMHRYACVVLASLLVVSLLGLSACASRSHTPASDNPYDWSHLTSSNGRYQYRVNGQNLGVLGIDVSDHNGTIDWKSVAADGIDFAVVRVGYRGYTAGGISLDDRFEANLSGARAAGLKVGVYFFSQATTTQEAKEEADFVIKQLNGASLDYPVVFDEEPVESAGGRANNLTREQQTAIAKAFLERIEKAGYQGMVYCNQNDSSRFDFDELSAWPVWYAEYGTSQPSQAFDYTIWQFTSTGSVKGVTGNVDIDLDLTAAR